MGIKISVITPTYNRGHLLTRCYDSLCEQEFNAFEWIIIDDGSSDDTKNVVKSFLRMEKYISDISIKQIEENILRIM